MFKNTGNLSFYLGIGAIVLALVWMVIVYVLIAKAANDADKQARLDKVIDVGKWFFVSVAIVVAATVISDGFRERDEDIKEIAVFDKYTTTVTKADGLEERRMLAEYFATVAPPGSLRDSWEAYKGVTDKQAEQAKKDLAEKAVIDAVKNPTQEQKQQREEITKRLEVVNKPLVSESTPPPVSTSEEWLISAGTDDSLGGARDELIKVRAVSPDARIYKKGSSFVTVIPNFVSRDEAHNRMPVIQKIKPDAFLIKNWCSSKQEMGDYVVCN